jgi:hypothetical protein
MVNMTADTYGSPFIPKNYTNRIFKTVMHLTNTEIPHSNSVHDIDVYPHLSALCCATIHRALSKESYQRSTLSELIPNQNRSQSPAHKKQNKMEM